MQTLCSSFDPLAPPRTALPQVGGPIFLGALCVYGSCHKFLSPFSDSTRVSSHARDILEKYSFCFSIMCSRSNMRHPRQFPNSSPPEEDAFPSPPLPLVLFSSFFFRPSFPACLFLFARQLPRFFLSQFLLCHAILLFPVVASSLRVVDARIIFCRPPWDGL